MLAPEAENLVFSTGEVLGLFSDLNHYALEIARVGARLHELAVRGALTFNAPMRVPDVIRNFELDEADSGDETEEYEDADAMYYPDDIKTDASDLSANSTCGMLSCVFVCVPYSSVYA